MKIYLKHREWACFVTEELESDPEPGGGVLVGRGTPGREEGSETWGHTSWRYWWKSKRKKVFKTAVVVSCGPEWRTAHTFKDRTEPEVLGSGAYSMCRFNRHLLSSCTWLATHLSLTGSDIFSYLDLEVFCSNSCKLHFTEEETESEWIKASWPKSQSQ